MYIRKSEEDAKIKSRFANFRPLFYGCLSFGVGIAFSYYIFSLNISYIIILSILFLIALGLAIFKKQFINFIVIIACFVAGVGAYFVESASFCSQKFDGQTCDVDARVSTHIYDGDTANYVYLILTGVKINNASSDNLALGVYTAENNMTFEAGMNLKFTTEIYDQFLFENDTFNSFAYKMNATHKAFVYDSDIKIVSENNLTLAETIRLYTKNLLHQFMPFEMAELSYSILFGDQTELDEQIKQDFATSGLGHLVAVSGLNTAVLIACLYWLLKKLRCTGLPRFLIVSVVLLFYCYLCSWTPSVVRATIMALVFLASALIGRRYDILSSLGVAGIAILIFQPFSVFDAGFLMSFLSVLAIGILVEPLTKFFTAKCKVPNKISNALAIDLCTTLAITPVLAVYFGKISFFSWLTNLICVPLFSFAYILVFALVIVVSVFKFLGFLFWVPSIIMQFIVWFSGVVASADWAIINLYTLSLFGILAFYFAIFFFSKICLLEKMQKLCAVSTSVMMAVMCVLVFDTAKIPNSNTYTQLNTNTPSAVITTQSGQVLVVGNQSLEYTENYLQSQKIKNVTYLVCTETDATSATEDFENKYNVKTWISYTSGLQKFGDFEIAFISLNGIKKAVYVNVCDVGILFAINNIGDSQVEKIRALLYGENVQALFETRESKNFAEVWNFNQIFSTQKIEGYKNNYATNIYGTFTFEINNGIIKT